jgi:hypothetical protein
VLPLDDETANGGSDTTGIGFGLRDDLNDAYHRLVYAGPGLQNAAADRYTWDASILFTF